MATWVSCPQACMAPSISEANASPVSSGIGSASMSPRSSTVGPGRPPSSTATTELIRPPEVHLQREVGERGDHRVPGAGQVEAELGVAVQRASQRHRARLHAAGLRR